MLVLLYVMSCMKTPKLIVPLIVLLSTFQYCISQDTCTFRSPYSCETITLFEHNKFTYYQFLCTHSVEGEGTYSMDDKELKLRFIHKPDSLNGKSRIVSIESKPNCTGTSKITFKVFSDKDNKPLHGAIITLGKKGTITKKNGEAILININSGTDLRFKVFHYDSKALELPLTLENQDYVITVNLASGGNFRQAVKIDEAVYKIANRTHDSIELSYYDNIYEKYEINCR